MQDLGGDAQNQKWANQSDAGQDAEAAFYGAPQKLPGA